MTMNDEINTEQPLILQPQCVDCRFYDGFGACTKHGYQLRDNCEDFVDMETTHKYVDDMENYEQKYNAALERAKGELRVCGSQDCDAARQIFRIFPELKESEDERIRKELITHCRNTRCTTEEGAEKIAQWVAWLEKQGHMLAPDKVIEWLENKQPSVGVYYKFKKDFGL